MPKGYMISAYRSPADLEKAKAYRVLAVPALKAMGENFLASVGRVVARENGVSERIILIDFESFDAAVAAYESDDYQKALALLDGGADRDIRLFEGLE